MKLDNWVGIAEIISAVAVVVSLVYVGLELSQNTEEVRAANRQQLINRAHTATLAYSSNPSFAALLARVVEGEALTRAERIQYSYAVRTVLYDAQEAYLLYLEGRLDEAYWDTRKNLVAFYLSNPLARDLYEADRKRGLVHSRFVEMLEKSGLAVPDT